MQVKTKKGVLHLIHGLIALSAVDNPTDLRMVQKALTRAKKGLSDHEIGLYIYLTILIKRLFLFPLIS